ncbi:hypothetical protein [Sphingobacterium sp. UBA6645]|uniref:hypothetical protein n=1 Tax=Sphingobacterium sp. UBA6645 TaxID=1947511 RepID=UPI0025CDC5E1|nr:hypothetical protein [Sphingobacterium sp. UBA6645]
MYKIKPYRIQQFIHRKQQLLDNKFDRASIGNTFTEKKPCEYLHPQPQLRNLKLHFHHYANTEVIVSRERVNDFKEWIE